MEEWRKQQLPPTIVTAGCVLRGRSTVATRASLAASSMSAANVATLMDMGATRMQAVKALAKYKGVMEAAEAIFADEVGQGDEGGDEAEDKYQDGGSASTLSKQEDTDDEADVDDEEGDSYYGGRIKERERADLGILTLPRAHRRHQLAFRRRREHRL